MPSSCSGSSPAGDPGSDDVHALVLRAWVERAGPGVPPRLRARLLELRRGRDPRPLVTTASVDECMAPQAPQRLTLLGGFALWRGSQQVPVTVGGQRLVALLALRDGPVGRLHVAETLWPSCSAERSLASLRTTLWRVSQAAGEVIAATPAVLSLAADIDVDIRNLATAAHRLNRCRGPGTVDLDAVRLADLVGELLPDWYDDWLQEEREGLRQTRLHALERLARALSAAGRHADGIQAALAAIRLEPLRETAHRTLIELHVAEGNWSEACRQYQRCRRLLRDELGVEPSDSTRLLLGTMPGASVCTKPTRSTDDRSAATGIRLRRASSS